jgi:hypothetical protein
LTTTRNIPRRATTTCRRTRLRPSRVRTVCTFVVSGRANARCVVEVVAAPRADEGA